MRNVDVNDQSQLKAAEFQIGENLCEVQRLQSLHCFEFHDNAVFDNEVDSVRRVQLDSLISDGQPHLMPERQSVLRELITPARVVRAFKAARPEGGVHLHRRAQNPFRDRNVQNHTYSSVSSVSSVVERFVAERFVVDTEARLQSPVL